MPKIFISYRRSDVPQVARQIYAELVKHVPKNDVFFDEGSIQYGANFLASIELHMILADIVLVPVGPLWNGQPGEHRLLDPNDFVRFELELALRHQKRVLPVLIGPQTRFPPGNELPPSLATFPFINAPRLPAMLSQRELQQVVSFVLAPPTFQTTSLPVPPQNPPQPQPVPPILPTPLQEYIFTYGPYRIVIPTRVYDQRKPRIRPGNFLALATNALILLFLVGCPVTIIAFVGHNLFFEISGIVLILLGLLFFVGAIIYVHTIESMMDIERFYKQLLDIAHVSPRGDERELVKSQREKLFLDKNRIFAWYQEYYKNPFRPEEYYQSPY